ncbi:MAG: hypothetical protein E7633_08920 [Ruminococcaceae bacterium]|nr:hypothetical protein [Oscillospiraceae bacterium]
MKKTLTSKVLSFVMAVLMVFGVASTGLIVVAENRPLKYVSIGDSMTNGYGLEGYEPNGENYYGFLVDTPEAYPHLVAKALGDADLIQLATSGLRAEDVYYLLNYGTVYGTGLELDEYGRYYVDSKFEDRIRQLYGNGGLDDDDFNRLPGGYLPNEDAHTYIISEAAEIFKQAVKDADVISIGIGSNNFATLLDMRVMYWMGVILGSESMFADSGYPGAFDFDQLIGDLTAEEKAQIAAVYAFVEKLIKEAAQENGISLDDELANGITFGDFVLDIANAVAYTTAGFTIGYKGVIDTIIRENDDAEIIIVGLTNWFAGMNFGMLVGDQMFVLPMGDIMEVVCEFAGVYMATLPAAYEAEAKQNGTELQPIYFADTNAEDVGDVELLVEQIIKNSPSVDFAVLNTLEGDEKFAAALEMAADIDLSVAIPEGTTGPRLIETLAATTPPIDFVQLGVQKSMIASLHAELVNVKHFEILSSMDVLGAKVMGVINSVLYTGGQPDEYGSNIIVENCTPEHVAAAFMCDPELVTISNLLFNFVVGSGVILHPSVDGHQTIANVIIDAYENKITAGDHMDALVKPYIDATINYFEDLGLELYGIIEKNFAPVVEQLEGELEILGGELDAKLIALNEKLMELTEKQEVILKDMLAERDAIAAELEALEEELAGLYAAPVSANGITKKMTATTVANTEEELVADLEAAIAETKAALDELDAAIAYVKGQIETDKSGIEAIKAAIEEIKANIAATEAALAEVNAAMNKLVSDLDDLGINLELLKKVAAGVKIDPEEVYEAVKGLLENLPETIATIEDLYEATVEAVETAKAAVEAIKASVEVINAKVENIIKSAEDLIAIEGEKAEEIKKAAEDIYALAEAFVKANLPAIEEALENTATEVDVVIAREIAKVEALWAEYGDAVKAAIAIAYLYCEEKGYIQLAEDYITDYIETAEEALEDLEKYLEELDLEDLDLENLDVEEIIAELEAKFDIEIDIEIDTTEAEVVIAKIKAYIQSVKDEIAKAKKALEDAKATVELLTSDAEAVFEALANLKETLCDLGNSVCDLKAAVKDEVLKLVGYANLIGEKVLGVVDTLDAYADIFVDGVIIAKNGIIAVIEELVYEATHADYVKDKDSYYVAFGDGTAVSESYVDLLAKELEVKFNNLAQAGLKVEDMFDIIDANVAEIKKADLITIGFGNNTFITEALNNALDYENAPEYDWAKYVGEEGAEYVAKALAELKIMLDEEGLGEMMGMPVSELAVIAVESYAYSCVAYAVNLPMIANEIAEINPEALVILIGMYNPLEGVVIDLGETKLDISDYLGYLAKAAGLESLIYAIVTGDATYVSAPDVDTKLDSEALDILDIINEFAINQGENLDPSADGHEYIKNQILEALNVTEEEVILLGDANNDGEVNAIDAMYILQYDAELIDAEEINLELADVNGDGKVNSIDAMYVLRYDAELIEKFPAEDKAA